MSFSYFANSVCEMRAQYEEQYEIFTVEYLTDISIRPFSTNVPLLYPLETENLAFSGGMQVKHWLKMG